MVEVSDLDIDIECLILTELAIKRESKEKYSIVRKGHKTKPEYADGDFSLHLELKAFQGISARFLKLES